MNIKKDIGRMINRYGRQVTLYFPNQPAKNKTYKAFLQPLRYKNKIYLEGILSEIGFVDEGHYLYLGPAEPSLTNLPGKTEIRAGNGSERYFVKRAEQVYSGGQAVYSWAVLQTLYEGEQLWEL